MSKELEYLADLHSHTRYENTDIESKKVILKAFRGLKQALTKLEQQEQELEELKDTIIIYLDLEKKIEKVGLTGLNEIEYSNYHKSYKNLKKLVGEDDD
jgi:hypothetical protein